MVAANPGEQLRARHLRHPLVGEHQRDLLAGFARPLELGQRSLGGALADDAVVVGVPALQLTLDLLESALVVIHRDQEGAPP